MRARTILMVGALLGVQVGWAQTVDEGRKFFYYERYNSAKDALQKAVNANPKDENAVYWLGQSMLELKDSVAAKTLYQNYLASNGSAPMVLVGMGQVELMEQKTNEARQRFEAAISLTKSKDIDVLNAVGRANAVTNSGDAGYAIEKLTAATEVRRFSNPEVLINMGNAYRKMADGGGAVTAYTRAFSLDPNYAAAKYYTAKTYQSQNNSAIFLPLFEEAIQVDAAYAPAFRELYHYYYSRDVNKAIEYLDKYIATTDQSPEIEYEKTSVLFAASKFQEAMDRAKSILAAQGANAYPKYHRLIAYSYLALGDSAQALTKIKEFQQVASPDLILPADYVLEGNLLLRDSATVQEGLTYISKAIEMDTSAAGKHKIASDVAKVLDEKELLAEAATWKAKAYTLNSNPSKQDLFYTGYAFIKAQEFNTADSVFNVYSTTYPDETFGHYWQARAKSALDTSGTEGLAVPHFLKFIEVASKDSVTNKSTLITAYGYMASYSANVLKDNAAAIGYFDKILALEPTNSDAIRFKEILIKMQAAAPANQKK